MCSFLVDVCFVGKYRWLVVVVFEHQSSDAIKLVRVAKRSVSEFCGIHDGSRCNNIREAWNGKASVMHWCVFLIGHIKVHCDASFYAMYDYGAINVIVRN